MSTILKALRRLEEDASSPSASGVGALPATDPRAADELRDRILAEETAAQLAAAAQRDSNRTLRRLGAAAGALLFLVGILVLVLDLGFGPDTRSTRADSNLDSIAVVAPATPSPVAAPHPEDRRARAAVAGVVPVQPTMERTAVSLVPVASVPTAVATLRAPIRLPNQPAGQPASHPPIPPETLAGEASSQGVSEESPPEAADQFALAAVAPTPALASAALTGTVTRSAPALTQKSPEPAATNSRAMSTTTVQNPASVSAPQSESIPKTRPGETRPSDGMQSEPEPRPDFPSDQVLRIDRRGLPDITVLRTAWHPNAERRSTRIRLEATDEILTLREGDSIGGLVIQEISPSAVLFNAGDVEIRRRVGEPGPDG